jgi:acyl-CoA dehydrogenase
MDFSPSPRVEELRGRVDAFLEEHVYPVELEALKALDEEVRPGVPYPRILVELRERAKAEGLWNLFLPGDEGAGLTNWEYGMLCETMGRSLISPMVFKSSWTTARRSSAPSGSSRCSRARSAAASR